MTGRINVETTSSTEWFNALKSDEFEDFKLDFAVSLGKALNSSGKNRTELAAALGVSQARITKVLRGDANLTMELMYKLVNALEHKIHINVAPKGVKAQWFQPMVIQNTNYNQVQKYSKSNAVQVLDENEYKIAA